MILTSVIIWYVIAIYQLKAVTGQVCVETKMVYRDVPETYQYTYMEAYESDFCLFWCTDKRVATAIGTRNVKKLFPEQINVCCKGYTKDEQSNGNSIHCTPYCFPSCINGYCKSPGTCACNPGYVPDIFDTHNCLPLCIKGCDHGTCAAPNTCLCDLGYNLINEVCEPECNDPCHNGSCVAPNTCQCHPGYRMSENNTCEPYCSSYTASGECIQSIHCEPGWTKVIKGSVEVCEPVCTETCVNAICIAPDRCECLKGYHESTNNSCEPICSSGCLHGSCISPETCVCDPGWYRKESSGACLAHCDHKCGNGTCVGPNNCECFPGYELDKEIIDQETETPVCVPVCSNCEGSCVSPGKCVCEYPQETVLVTADGDPCNCTENCSDDESKCERTICVKLSTHEITTATEWSTDQRVEDTTILQDTTSTTDILLRSTTAVTNNAETEYDSTTLESNEIEYNEIKIAKASWTNSYWLYAIGSTLVLIMLVVIAAAIFKKKYSNALDRNLNTHDNYVSTVHYKKKTTA